MRRPSIPAALAARRAKAGTAAVDARRAGAGAAALVALATLVGPILGPIGGARAAEPEPGAEPEGQGAAAATEEAKARFKEATEAFKQGDYARALQGYQAAYRAKPLPALLFNIGQCFYNMGRYEEAREAYRRFLASDVDDDRRAAVEQMLRDVDAKLADKVGAPSTDGASSTGGVPVAEDAAVAGDGAIGAAAVDASRAGGSARAEGLAERAGSRAADDVDEAEGADGSAGAAWLVPTLVGAGAALVVVGAGAIAAGVWAATPPPVVPPSGTVGTLDRRGSGG